MSVLVGSSEYWVGERTKRKRTPWGDLRGDLRGARVEKKADMSKDKGPFEKRQKRRPKKE